MSDKHTPLPWVPSFTEFGVSVHQAGGLMVAWLESADRSGGLSRDRHEADAELICTAVNAHAALLSVCRQLARLKTGPTEARRAEWIERVLSLAEQARTVFVESTS